MEAGRRARVLHSPFARDSLCEQDEAVVRVALFTVPGQPKRNPADLTQEAGPVEVERALQVSQKASTFAVAVALEPSSIGMDDSVTAV